ncbi:hypothetical protein ACQ90T_004104 [Escherichia coli]
MTERPAERAFIARKKNAESVLKYAKQFSKNNKAVEEKIRAVIVR